MANDPADYAVIYDPENGFQLINLATNEVADMAVLEKTWRKRGAEAPASSDVQGHLLNLQAQVVASPQPSYLHNYTTLQYGALRLRSTGRLDYAIADPRVSLRDDQSPST
jgi:hypothetical protein